MDIVDVRSIALVITFVAFCAIAWWAFSPSRRERFNEDAKLPFAEDDYVNSPGKPKKVSDDTEKTGHNKL